MKKKILSVLLVTSLVLGGCSNGTSGTSDKNSTSEAVSEEASTEDAEEEISDDAASSESTDETSEESTEEGSEAEETAGDSASAEEEEASTDVSSIDTSVMTPWINSNILGIVTDDVNPDLKDDFYLNINHDYLRDAKLRPGYTTEMPILDAADIVKERCTDILTDKTLEGRDVELCQGLYEMYLDWDKRNEIGVKKIEPIFEQLKNVSSIEELNDFMMTEDWYYYGNYLALVTLGVNNDDSSLYQVDIYSTPLSLGDSAEYEELTANGERNKDYNDKIACYMLGRLGYSEEESQKIIDERLSFETKIAKFEKTYLEKSDPAALKESINMVTMDDIKEMSPNYPLAQFMENFGFAKSELININEPKWLEGLNELYNEDNFEEIKSYYLATAASSLITYIDEEAFRAYQDYYMEKTGITEVSSDEKEAYDMVMSMLSDNLSRIYIEKYLTPEMKEEITNLCKECIDTYYEMLDSEEWLSEETREKAKDKLSNLTIHAVYPDKWEDDSMLEFTSKEDGGDYLSALEELWRAIVEINLSHINGKVDKEIWGINILDTNAYYNPTNNSINIIPGFFCDATYRSDMTIEEKYGALGSVIGHEISHAFDTNGAQFDSDGNVKDWWTEEDYTAFSERATKLVQYYDNVIAFDDGTPYKGQLVQTEAIADMAGLKCMLTMAKKVEGFDYDKFFRSYEYMWARTGTLAAMQSAVLSDSHPLHYLRGNVTVQQFDEFLDTYDIKEGDGMYLAPEDRIAVW